MLDANGKHNLGRGAYQHYGVAVGFVNFKGDKMPEWTELPETIQDAWIAAAMFAYSVGANNGRLGAGR